MVEKITTEEIRPCAAKSIKTGVKMLERTESNNIRLYPVKHGMSENLCLNWDKLKNKRILHRFRNHLGYSSLDQHHQSGHESTWIIIINAEIAKIKDEWVAKTLKMLEWYW